MAEDELDKGETLYCLGDIVHNNREVERLEAKGLKIIDHETLKQLKNTKVLIRAHGEPPETYKIALENNIELIDASCPVVLKLQNRIRKGYEDTQGQIVLYGKQGHAEVNGLAGQTNGKAIVVNSVDDLDKVDFTKPIQFFSQTTQSTDGFEMMKKAIEERIKLSNPNSDLFFEANDTLCRQVSNREPQLKEFAARFDLIVFVSGKKSANGRVLFEVCQSVNSRTYFVSSESEIEAAWFNGINSVGICGATSTPMWLMEEVEKTIIQKTASLSPC
jgi:4-hydroxy-3-methylbut-2-enyl diphosphate reductase